MAALKRFASDEGVQLYKNAKHLSEIESKNDPSDEPFRSKYKARELYKELNDSLKDKLGVSHGEDTEDAQNIIHVILCIDFLLGQLFIDVEETSEGEKYLLSIVKTITEKIKPFISLHINTLNSLGILASQRGNLSKCMDYFNQAEKLYHEWKENSENDIPLSYLENLEEFEGNEDEKVHQRINSFESTHTHTLYYLAQGFAKQEKNSLSAHYCHITLQRQLKFGDYSQVDWAMNAVTLSQYYLTSDKFPEARHCLSSGSFVFNQTIKNEKELSEAEKEVKIEEEELSEAEKKEQSKADIDRCWVKYGLALLEASRDQMLNEVENSRVGESDNDTDVTDSQNDCNSEVADQSSGTDSFAKNNPEEEFEKFDLDLVSKGDDVTDKFVRTFEEAKKIFLFIIEKINSTQKFYTPDSHASDAVEIIQDNSKAFKLLAFFELDMQRQCIMHKRRADMLTKMLNELNPKYYLLVCRQLMFELAETFSTMVDLKLAITEMDQLRITPHAIIKINKLIQQSIDQYQAYIDSLKDGKPELPPEFPPGDVRPALVAFVCMGRLYSKIIVPELPRRLFLMKKSQESYKSVVDYCSLNPDSKNLVPDELSICKEMVQLIPLKMERLKQQECN